MTVRQSKSQKPLSISIHIPRVGDDLALKYAQVTLDAFQSTSPVWGMTTKNYIYGMEF